MNQVPPVRFISAEELRRRFNHGRYWDRARSGEFRQVLLRDGHPSQPLAKEPPCTRSQIIAYLAADGTRIAVVHQYLRRDGQLGAGGRPDPKLLVEDGVRHVPAEPSEADEAEEP